jgi:signal transduction histidine kinase
VSIAAACGGWIAAGVLTALWLAAQRVLDARMEAVARACHELRGPIGAARLGLELASRAGSLSAEQLRAIDSELGRATLALEDLAAAAEGRNPRWEAGAVDLESLLAETVAAWTPSAAAAGIELRMCWTGGTSPVRADRLRLAQATSNLIANAIEHGGEWVEVRGCSKPPSGETEEGRPGLAIAARIEVIDDGRGLPVPLDELTRRARRGRGRRGRGLAIAAGVAASHGGHLTAEASEHGAHLTLELPAAAGAQRAARVPLAPRVPSAARGRLTHLGA